MNDSSNKYDLMDEIMKDKLLWDTFKIQSYTSYTAIQAIQSLQNVQGFQLRRITSWLSA